MRIREEGLADRGRLAAGRIDVMMRDPAQLSFDVLITHNRLTLRFNRNAEPLLALAPSVGSRC